MSKGAWHEVREEAFCVAPMRRGFLLRNRNWAYLQYGEEAGGGRGLFDMGRDPGQFTNLADDPSHAATALAFQNRLKARLQAVRTNDLDIETLELLEDLLIKYDGTVILVSHDRAFLDNVVSSLLVFEGDGKLVEHVGGYSSWRAAAKSTPSEMTNTINNSSNYVERKKRKSDTQKKKRAIEKVTDDIHQAEQQIEALHEQTSKATFFESSREQQAKIYAEIKSLESKLSDLMQKWEELEVTEE